MTSQAARRPESSGSAARRSKITPEREQEFFDAVLEQIRECGYEAVTMEGVAASRVTEAPLAKWFRSRIQRIPS